MATKKIHVDYLARVEGEGSLTVRLRGDSPGEVELGIFEPPRLFEAFLEGRSQMEVPDITSRICGICPVAYLMSACHAIEDAHGLTLPPALRALRRLLYCGEWIESHALHLFLLHLPDFVRQPDVFAIAREQRERIEHGLRMKAIGNGLVAFLGGREIHPVNVRVGGFYSVPERAALTRWLPELEWARDAMGQALVWLAALPVPDFERNYEFVALHHPSEYAILEGRLVSNRGLDIAVEEFAEHFVEEQVPYSTALHATHVNHGAYFCGPLARFNLNFAQLSPLAQQAARAVGLEPPCRNPFRSLQVRAVEALYAFDEAIRLIREYQPPDRPFIDVPRGSGTGHGLTEAPRGSLYHRYQVDEQGLILNAKITPPTSQNQRSIEEDLMALGPRLAAMSRPDATWLAEQAVRNYDPCISCSTHMLRLPTNANADAP